MRLIAAAGVGLALLAGLILAAWHPWDPPGSSRQDVSQMTIHSAALGRDMPALVWVPTGADVTQPIDVLMLFHGRGGNETSWFGDVGVDAIAASLAAKGSIRAPVIVSAMIDDSYGVDSGPGNDGYAHGAYERYILEDLVPAVDARVPGAADPTRRFIGGLSMGAFAALHVSFRHAELFAGVAALSPAIWRGTIDDRRWVYPTADTRADHDPLELARTAPITTLKVFLGWGDQDFDYILDAGPVLVQRLQARGMPVKPAVVVGGHQGSTWNALSRPMLETLFAPGHASNG